MSKLENKEKNVATIKIEISAENFNTAIDKAYAKNKGRYNVSGFRRGKAPRRIIENRFGEGVFYQDALDIAFPDEYEKTIEEIDIKPVSMPMVKSIDKISATEGVELVVEVALEPEFELGEYEGIEVDKITTRVTKKDIDARLETLRDQNSRLVSVDTPAENGDTTIIDFEGFTDGEAFEGGKGENYNLVLGSGSFIPGFEDQLIGKQAGEDVDVNVTFPNEYQATELAGKDALFKVKIHEVKHKELPELDDDFAGDVSEFDTLDELKADLKTKIKKEKENEKKNNAYTKILETVIERTEIDIPEVMIKERADQVKKQFEQQIQSNGMDPKTYYEIVKAQGDGKDVTDFQKMFEEQAINDIKQELVVGKLIEAENIEASEEEMEKEYAEFAKVYNQDIEEFKKNLDDYTKNYVEGFIKQRKLFDALLEKAVQK